ncbi:MAG: dihydropteroate synthase [Nitrospinaceae bacterium]
MPLSIKLNGEDRSVSIMGILNLSPDSFYEGSRCLSVDQAVRNAERFVEEGADILDLGAESTRPGSKPLSAEVELERLLPVVKKLLKKVDVPLSVDTYKPQVAERVLGEGVSVINDITGLQKYPSMAGIIARHGAGVVMMHIKGTPETMQDDPQYQDLFGEILSYLEKSIHIAGEAGIDPGRMMVDPGIGFGKTPQHCLELVAGLDRFKSLNKPVLLGVSRKSFIGHAMGGAVAEERLEGSLAAAVIGVLKGASVLRVHDVGPTVRAVQMVQAICNGEAG